MRVLGFSKTKSSATILVDNIDNITYIATGNYQAPSKKLKPLKKGHMPIFLMKFKTDFKVHQTSTNAYMDLIDDQNKWYSLYSESFGAFISLSLDRKIQKDEDGFMTAVFRPLKKGSVTFLEMLDPDDLQLKEEI